MTIPSDPLQDDLGNSFPEDRLARIPPDLARSIAKRPLIDAHMLLLFGIFSLVFFYVGRPSQYSQFTYGVSRAWKLQAFGITSVITALARYAGVGPRARTDRRLLLKRALCPVCLAPLDKRHAHGETITCTCGATWERRYM